MVCSQFGSRASCCNILVLWFLRETYKLASRKHLGRPLSSTQTCWNQTRRAELTEWTQAYYSISGFLCRRIYKSWEPTHTHTHTSGIHQFSLNIDITYQKLQHKSNKGSIIAAAFQLSLYFSLPPSLPPSLPSFSLSLQFYLCQVVGRSAELQESVFCDGSEVNTEKRTFFSTVALMDIIYLLSLWAGFKNTPHSCILHYTSFEST